MRFFAIVGITLVFIAVFNLIHVSVEMYLKGDVYACSDVTKYDPLQVQKKCRK